MRAVLLKAVIVPPVEVQRELDRLGDAVAGVLGGLEEQPAALQLPITGFGNLTTPDARRLVDALTEALVVVDEDLVVRFSGVTITADGQVLVGMAGDVDALVQLARFVPTVVQGLRLYTDRRRFWPGVVLGRTTAAAEALGDLGTWEGSDWRVPAITITRLGRPADSVHAEVRLADHGTLDS